MCITIYIYIYIYIHICIYIFKKKKQLVSSLLPLPDDAQEVVHVRHGVQYVGLRRPLLLLLLLQYYNIMISVIMCISIIIIITASGRHDPTGIGHRNVRGARTT